MKKFNTMIEFDFIKLNGRSLSRIEGFKWDEKEKKFNIISERVQSSQQFMSQWYCYILPCFLA